MEILTPNGGTSSAPLPALLATGAAALPSFRAARVLSNVGRRIPRLQLSLFGDKWSSQRAKACQPPSGDFDICCSWSLRFSPDTAFSAERGHSSLHPQLAVLLGPQEMPSSSGMLNRGNWRMGPNSVREKSWIPYRLFSMMSAARHYAVGREPRSQRTPRLQSTNTLDKPYPPGRVHLCMRPECPLRAAMNARTVHRRARKSAAGQTENHAHTEGSGIASPDSAPVRYDGGLPWSPSGEFDPTRPHQRASRYGSQAARVERSPRITILPLSSYRIAEIRGQALLRHDESRTDSRWTRCRYGTIPQPDAFHDRLEGIRRLERRVRRACERQARKPGRVRHWDAEGAADGRFHQLAGDRDCNRERPVSGKLCGRDRRAGSGRLEPVAFTPRPLSHSAALRRTRIE